MRDVMKTNILFLITKGSWGGAQSYVYDLAINLPKDKYEVGVLCGEGSELGTRLRRQSIVAYELPGLGRNVSFWKDLFTLRSMIKMLRGIQPDIIHLNSSKMGLLGAIAGRWAGVKKIVFTGHGWAFNEERPRWQKIIIRFLQWLTIILCTDTIAVSRETKEQIADWPSFRKKISVIHNGLGPIDFYGRDEAREKLGLDKEKFVIGTIAELHKNKGLDFLIPAFAMFNQKNPENKEIYTLCSDGDSGYVDKNTYPPTLACRSNAILTIVGQGEKKADLEKLVEKSDLAEKVFFLGRIEEARKYLKAFDLFILPSRTEALPYVLLEASQAGLPIIASRVGGIPEIVQEGTSGLLIEAGNIKKLAAAMEQIYKDKNLASHLGEEAQRVFAENFSLDKMLGKTISVYCNSKNVNLPSCKK